MIWSPLWLHERSACGDIPVVEWSADYEDGRVYWNVTSAEFFSAGNISLAIRDTSTESKNPRDRKQALSEWNWFVLGVPP